MRYPRTNYTESITQFFDLKTKSQFIEFCGFSNTNPILITNPILSALVKVFLDPAEVPASLISTWSDNDMAYCKFTGHVLARVALEARSNKRYFEELKHKLLGYRRGQYFSAVNEIIVASYLKYLGYSTKFNSSFESAKPDIEVNGNFKFAIDVKTFPDNEFWFEGQILDIMPQLFTLLKELVNVNLIAFVSKHNSKVKKELIDALTIYIRTKQAQNLSSCSIFPFSQYAGTQGIALKNIRGNSTLRIIPSIPLNDDEILAPLYKAVKQQTSVSSEGMTWILFPNDKEFSMGRRLVWEVSNIPNKMKEINNNLVLYDFYIRTNEKTSQWETRYGADFLIDTDKYPNITKKTFDSYFIELLNTPTIYIN